MFCETVLANYNNLKLANTEAKTFGQNDEFE